MPYKRYTGRKRKRTYYKKGFDRNVGFYGRNIKRRKMNTNGARYKAGVERKFYDLLTIDGSLDANSNVIPITAAGPVGDTTSINDIPQGTGESQRIGRKCTITRISAKLSFEWDDTGGTSADLTAAERCSETIRILLYWDKQCNGTAAPPTSLLDVDVYNSFPNLANTNRYRFLYDKTFAWNTTAIGAGNGTANDSIRVVHDYQVNLAINTFIPIEFSSTAGALTEIKSNNIGILIYAKAGGRMLLRPSRIRIRFMDF